jgi:hypothetical protein
MTKVEELRESLIAKNKTESYVDYLGVTHTTETFHRISVEELDAVIAAAHAEGVAEERERIREAGDFVGCDGTMSCKFATGVDNQEGLEDITADCDLYVVPASVLAPTRESEK